MSIQAKTPRVLCFLLAAILSSSLLTPACLAETTGGAISPSAVPSQTIIRPVAPALQSIGEGADLRPIMPTVAPNQQALTLKTAVEFAAANYPSILRAQAQSKAARESITVQKLNEYMPDSLIQYQEVMASHNKLSQIIYGSPVFPANPGPGFPTVGMNPLFFSGIGFNLDWAPLDFGLHRARISLAREQYNQSQAQVAVTLLDAEISAATAFLDVAQAIQQVKAAEENVHSFESFATIVEAQVKAQLKPGADAALSQAELANARNELYRAQLNLEVARINLSNALGLGAAPVSVIDRGLAAVIENGSIQQEAPVFDRVPVLQFAHETVLTAIGQRRVLSKEYFPTFHFLGGVQNRGAELNNAGHVSQKDMAGLLPTVPNYQVAMIMNWNFLDWFRLHAEKKVQNQRIIAQQQQYNQVLQDLQAEDARSRARVRTAINIAMNMPTQVAAAEQASSQAQARYQVGLSSVAQVAEANQVLANSRMQEAVANVGVWRAMLGVASAHGDILPFLAEADRVQR